MDSSVSQAAPSACIYVRSVSDRTSSPQKHQTEARQREAAALYAVPRGKFFHEHAREDERHKDRRRVEGLQRGDLRR